MANQCGNRLPIHIKEDKRKCTNYRSMSLISVPGKVYAKCLEKKCSETVCEVKKFFYWGECFCLQFCLNSEPKYQGNVAKMVFIVQGAMQRRSKKF